jgi:predicted naringenin-chalcone synthase
MQVFIHDIQTLLPQYSAEQSEIAKRLGDWSEDPTTARLIRHVLQKAGIDRRHSVLPDFTESSCPEIFVRGEDGRTVEPGTEARNRCFVRHAGRMAVEIGERLLNGSAGFAASDITHVITVSCTGFVNPGADYRLVTELKLSPKVERYNLGFMGCYAALPALRLADQCCRANPEAVVLVVCVELCSLHMQVNSTPDSILANALFSDGAAGVLVSARPPSAVDSVLALDGFGSAIAVEGAGEMAWEIGDRGFNLVLSSYVPDVIAANVNRIVDDLLSSYGAEQGEIPFWAVHPGGKAILDKVEKSLGLRPPQLAASRDVLRNCGNMSSVTVLFVMERILRAHVGESTRVVAMAFGPGLTVETALLELQPASAALVNRELTEATA